MGERLKMADICIGCGEILNEHNYNNKYQLCDKCYSSIKNDTKEVISNTTDNNDLTFQLIKLMKIMFKEIKYDINEIKQ